MVDTLNDPINGDFEKRLTNVDNLLNGVGGIVLNFRGKCLCEEVGEFDEENGYRRSGDFGIKILDMVLCFSDSMSAVISKGEPGIPELYSWSIIINRVMRIQVRSDIEINIRRLHTVGDFCTDSSKVIYYYIGPFKFIVCCCLASLRRSSPSIIHAHVSTPKPKVNKRISRRISAVNIRISHRFKLKASKSFA